MPSLAVTAAQVRFTMGLKPMKPSGSKPQTREHARARHTCFWVGAEVATCVMLGFLCSWLVGRHPSPKNVRWLGFLLGFPRLKMAASFSCPENREISEGKAMLEGKGQQSGAFGPASCWLISEYNPFQTTSCVGPSACNWEAVVLFPLVHGIIHGCEVLGLGIGTEHCGVDGVILVGFIACQGGKLQDLQGVASQKDCEEAYQFATSRGTDNAFNLLVS